MRRRTRCSTIRQTVEEELATRGLVRSTGGTPDLRLRYAMQVRPSIRLSYPGYYEHYGFGHHGFHEHRIAAGRVSQACDHQRCLPPGV